MKKSTVLFVFAALLTVSITSCGSKIVSDSRETAETAGNTEIAETAETAEVIEEEEPRLPLNLEDRDLGGFTMTMFQSDTFAREAGSFSDGMTGEPVNDAIFSRNSKIMDQYNCVIEEIRSPQNNITQ